MKTLGERQISEHPHHLLQFKRKKNENRTTTNNDEDKKNANGSVNHTYYYYLVYLLCFLLVVCFLKAGGCSIFTRDWNCIPRKTAKEEATATAEQRR